MGIVAKLACASAILLAIPLLTLRYLRETHDFVLDGQRRALELAAQAVATVLHDRGDLFDETGGGPPFSPWSAESCAPLPLEAPVRLDGDGRDWPRDPERTCRYQRAESAWREPLASVALELRLAQREAQLYALVEVRDDAVRLRDPRYRSLDAADHLRLSVPSPEGERRYVLTAEEPGPVTAYRVGESWRYAEDGGRPVAEIRGVLQRTRGGYAVELRLPIAMLPRRRIGLAIADVDAAPGGPRVVAAVPSGAVDLVLRDAPETLRILRGLDLPDGEIRVVDSRGRTRAQVGAVPTGTAEPQRARLARLALGGTGVSDAGDVTTAAAFPIRVGDAVVGAVLVEQANDRILALPRRALERERNAVIAACVAVAAVLWLFAWRLAWRIRRLRDDAAGAIDADGRVARVALAAGRRAGDEIGDLSRTMTGLLARLGRYTSFLERIPSTLRHELANPLNVLSTSLENLARERPDVARSRYLDSAERGVSRIGEIVQRLTEAASLEEALRHDEHERLDLAALVRGYVENFQASCPERKVRVRGDALPLEVLGSGFRLEQLLDKLLDNAVDFSPAGSEIAIELEHAGDRAVLRVRNQGPPPDPEVRARLFESLFSTRASRAGGSPHLGLGLYVVGLIAARMGGRVDVADAPDADGAGFVVELPLSPSAPGYSRSGSQRPGDATAGSSSRRSAT